MKAQILSVASFAENAEIASAVIKSDNIRHAALNICYAMPDYESLPLNQKNTIYDRVVKGIIAQHIPADEL